MATILTLRCLIFSGLLATVAVGVSPRASFARPLPLPSVANHDNGTENEEDHEDEEGQELPQRPADPSGPVQLDSDKLQEIGDVLCGELETGWAPGRLNRRGLFFGHLVRSKRFRKRARSAESEEREERFLVRARKFRRLHKQEVPLCQEGSEGGTGGGGLPAPVPDGRFIVEETNPVLNGQNFFDTAYRAYLGGQLVFTIAVGRGNNKAHALHATHVGLEYLDNDEDGTCDNPTVCAKLAESNGGAIVFISSRQEELFTPPTPAQDLRTNEVFPDSGVYPNGTRQRFDASLEEVLHYLTDNGWSKAYPGVFGPSATSSWGANVGAIIGQGLYDPTKAGDTSLDDYSTTVPESLYWVMTSLMGAQGYAWRIPEVSAEWKSYTPALVQQNLPGMYTLISDPQYGFPRNLPNGTYAPASSQQ